ncbi:MAG: 5'/3'-nucleotidase SurE [Candidatus Brocadiia bacterium]
MRILLTNDDGLETEGLVTFKDILRQRHQLTVIAPLFEQSAISHSISILSPIFVKKITYGNSGRDYIYAVKGTPADCVKLALGHYLKRRPDMVVSGINLGANLGLDIFYSGTVAAAIEASFWGITSFAVSVERPREMPARMDFAPFIRAAYKVIMDILKTRPEPGSVFNINIPYRPVSKIKGIRFTCQDMRLVRERFVKGIDPRGRLYFWMKAGPELSVFRRRPRIHPEHVHSDIESVHEGYISVTPIKAQFTDAKILANPPVINTSR